MCCFCVCSAVCALFGWCKVYGGSSLAGFNKLDLNMFPALSLKQKNHETQPSQYQFIHLFPFVLQTCEAHSKLKKLHFILFSDWFHTNKTFLWVAKKWHIAPLSCLNVRLYLNLHEAVSVGLVPEMKLNICHHSDCANCLELAAFSDLHVAFLLLILWSLQTQIWHFDAFTDILLRH